jgi:hypothetical protein
MRGGAVAEMRLDEGQLRVRRAALRASGADGVFSGER